MVRNNKIPSDLKNIFMASHKMENICEEIRRKIIKGQYPPGSPLSEIPLSREYGVTRARIRQVLQILEEESLIERFPYRGAFVKSITQKELQEIFEVREAVESMAARLAARRREEDALRAMERLFGKYRNSSPHNRLKEKVEIGEKFHQFIIESSKNRKIYEIINRLKFPIMRIWETGFQIPDRIHNAFKEHLAILHAIAQGKDALAEKKMRKHISQAFKDYIRITMLQETKSIGFRKKNRRHKI